MGNGGASHLHVLAGVGDGTFRDFGEVTNWFAAGALADVNGDGVLDLYGLTQQPGSFDDLVVQLGEHGTDFAAPLGYGHFPDDGVGTYDIPLSVALTDFDGDHHIDALLGVFGPDSTVFIMRGRARPAGSFYAPVGVPVDNHAPRNRDGGLVFGGWTAGAISADLDADGRPDVVAPGGAGFAVLHNVTPPR